MTEVRVFVIPLVFFCIVFFFVLATVICRYCRYRKMGMRYSPNDVERYGQGGGLGHTNPNQNDFAHRMQMEHMGQNNSFNSPQQQQQYQMGQMNTGQPGVVWGTPTNVQ